MKKEFLSFLLLILGFRLAAQQSFDILSYTAPTGWNQQQQTSQVTLKKTLSIKNPCSITMYSSEISSGDGMRDLKSQWSKYVKNVFSNVKDSITIETDRAGEWFVYSTRSSCIVNKREVNYIFTTLVSGKKIISILAVTADDLCLDEINNFYATLEVQGAAEKRKAVIKKQSKFRSGKSMKETVVPKTN
jgi:hypothetical protein